MKKWKFALISLIGISTLPITVLSSCNTQHILPNYQWTINKGNFTYELISQEKGNDFKIKITATSGYAIHEEKSSYFIDKTQKPFELHNDGVLTIPASEIKNSAIRINVVTILVPQTISISYNKGQTNPTILYDNEVLEFDAVVYPEQAEKSIEFKTTNPGVAIFEDNVLKPIGIGIIEVYAQCVGYKTTIESQNRIQVDVQALPEIEHIDDEYVPTQVDSVIGQEKVGFLFRGFKSNFNLREIDVTPTIYWPNGANESATATIVNIVNDNFNKSTFDIYIEYDVSSYDHKNHKCNIQFNIDGVDEPEMSKELTLHFAETSKTIDTLGVSKTANLTNMSQVHLAGFKANFEFSEDSYDQIEFVGCNNQTNDSLIVVSTEICNIEVLQDKTTTFDLDVTVNSISQLVDSNIELFMYLNKTFLSTLDVEVKIGDYVIATQAGERSPVINDDKPQLTITNYETNFDFRVPGETGSESKPLLTVEWPGEQTPLPAPNIIVEHSQMIESANDGTHYFDITYEWNEKFDLTKWDNYYLFAPIVKKNDIVIANQETMSIFLLSNITPYRINTDLTMPEGETKTRIHDYIFSGNYSSFENLTFIFESSDGLPMPAFSIDNYSPTGRTYVDGVFMQTLLLDWGQSLDLTQEKHFSLTFVDSESGDVIVPKTDFTIHAPKENNYWKIDTSKCKGATLDVIENTANEIKFHVDNIEENYEFIGFSIRQHNWYNVEGILFDWENNTITVDTSIMNAEQSGFQVDCIIDAFVDFVDPLDNTKNVLLNNEFMFDMVTTTVDAIKSDQQIDVVAGQQYHLHVDTKNWHIHRDSVWGFMFGVGNLVDLLSIYNFVDIDFENTYVYINGIGSLYPPVYQTYAIFGTNQLTKEEFKNCNFDIMVTPLNDRNNCNFNLFSMY